MSHMTQNDVYISGNSHPILKSKTYKDYFYHVPTVGSTIAVSSTV